MAASTVLASLVAQVKGVKFYDVRSSGAGRGERVVPRRQPNNAFGVNCVEMLLLQGRLLLEHIETLLSLERHRRAHVSAFYRTSNYTTVLG